MAKRKYEYVLEIYEPNQIDPSWSISFGRYGNYKIFNLESEPFEGKVRTNSVQRVQLEEKKIAPPDSKLDIQNAVREALRK